MRYADEIRVKDGNDLKLPGRDRIAHDGLAIGG
jgi:hypothetical protein